MDIPRFANALSTDPDSARAEAECLSEVEEALDGREPDLLVAFATHHHGSRLEELGPRLARATGAEVVLGCTGVTVIGGSREAEGEPGLSLWAASLPGTTLRFFETGAAQGDEGVVFSGLPPVGEADRSSVLLMADPFTFPMDTYLQELDRAHPGVPAMGGMASGGQGPGQHVLFTPEGFREAGAIGVVLEGGIELRPVVSQGCRPVGQPFVITDCDENKIKKLGGKPALEVLMETWRGLDPEEQQLMQRMPFVGLAIDAARSTFERGDFLVRNIMGVDNEKRWVAVADYVRRGQTIQFLVRDAASASEDLEQLMASQGGGAHAGSDASAGALLFTCTGRGSHMFPMPHHDVSRVHMGLDATVPVAGFFANGEIGPVGGRNFLHGFTASVAVFRPRDEG